MARDIEALVLALNGAPIGRTDEPGWRGFFAGHVTIQNIVSQGDRLHFELCFPTTHNDFNDYISSKEREAGTTEKVRLTMAGKPIDARVVGIVRRGADSRFCDDQGPGEEYQLTFDVRRKLVDAQVGGPLRVHFIFPHDKQDVVYAVAEGAV